MSEEKPILNYFIQVDEAQRQHEKVLRHIEHYGTKVFRESPAFASIVVMDIAEAEKLVTAFRAAFPEIGTFHLNAIAKWYPQERFSAMQRPVFYPGKQDIIPLKEPRNNCRVSSKTGATWPKPKGSY